MYEVGFGNIYHQKCHGLTCRDIPRDLDYSNRRLVHHNHQGKRIKKQNGRLVFFKGVEIDGKQIKRPREASSIRKKIKTTITDFKSEDILHEECLPSFPAWKGQIESLTEKLKDGGLETTLRELNLNWKDWTREAAKAYLSREEIRVPCIGRAPWRHIMAQNTEKISSQLRLNNKIITMFFKKYRERCLIDCSFLLSENGRSVFELEKQLKDFVVHTKKILSFEWPMAVANLMLDEGASWIPLFVTSTSHTVFNAVAATMARLLYDVVMENINKVKTFFDMDDRAKLIIILNEDEKEFDYWQRINILLDICKIPRVDHKIYPRMFTEAWIDVRNWFDSQSIVFKPLPQPFEQLNSRISQVQEMLVSFEKDPDDVEFWEKIAKEVLDIREQVLKQGTRTLKGFIIYDSRDIKKRSLARITELEERTKHIILTRLIVKNTKIREVFVLCSGKLFRNDVLVQLRNIEEVQNELPNIKDKIQCVGKAYKVYMEYFTMPDYDIRQFYEISRLGFKLEQLVNFVWDRINHDRQWITKQVSEQTSKNYYECEMIEKEWLDCLKKYRSAVRINEVQKVQIKMGNLEERSAILKGKDEKLIGQRSLLGLPSSPIDCARIAKVCEFFSKLSTLHFQTLLHHESCLRMRISDVDHNFLVAETERLQAEKDSLVEKATIINEHVTTSKEALLKIQNVLVEFEKLLPVLGAISCQAMKDRHWKMILQDSETSVKVEGNPLVSELLEMNFIEKADKFEQVGAQAEKERVLETSIDKMRSQWKSATFVTHQGGELLTTELNVQMQAHLARSQTILSSPHAFSILDHIRHWLDTLLNLNTFVHLYKKCDIRWKKIEGVFSTEDIAYQMPHEFRTFKKISLRWLHINNQITEERPILEQMDLVQQLNIDLSELEVLFGRMENGFHAYLRKKRAVFPRLFTLSDELVLSLICDSREPANCKSYIPLLFPSLTTFEQNTKMEIISVSTKSETISLVKPVNVNLSKRHVEKWMHELDAQIKYTLRTRIRLLIEKMNYKLSPVESILSEPIQVASIYLKIAFTWQMENSMKQNSMTILASELKICIRDCQHATIHKQERREFLPVLYHIYKSATHLVNKFINEQVIFIDDLRWTSQLRYYYHMENVFIRVGTVSARYEYEVQGIDSIVDCRLIDEAVKYFIYMNHFGFNGKVPGIDVHLARQIAGALGKPFAICDTEQEMDSKMLIEGSLLFGGTVFIGQNSCEYLGKSTEKDVYTSHNLANLKYHFESEITLNSSFMFLLSSSLRTARNLQLGSPSYYKQIDETLSLNSIAHREKKIQKFQIISEFENYSGAVNLWRNYTEEMLTKIVENESLDQEQIIETTIYRSLNVFMNKKNRKLLENLLNLTFLKPKKSPTPSRTPKSSDVPRKALDPDPLQIGEKTEDLINLLQNHQVVVVCGASLTGKSRIISKAAKLKSADLEIEYGLWEDIQVFGESLKNMRRPNKWIVIDGFMSQKTRQWVHRLTNENTLFPWRELPIIASCEKVIIETDCLSDDLKFLPMVFLDNSDDFIKETTLETTEKQRIDEVLQYYSEFKYRKLELIRKVEGLKKQIATNSEKVFENILVTSLLTFVPVQQLRSFFFKSDEKLLEFYKNVPYSNGWYAHKESMEISPPHFFLIHSIGLILYSDFIPLLVCPPSQEFFEFLSRLQVELDALGWHIITMSLDEKVTIEEIKQFVDNCSIMFGGHQNQQDKDIDDAQEGSNFFLIRGIENTTSEVIDWLRHEFERKRILKMLFITPYSVETFHKRIQRFLFQINWMDINGEESLTLFPLSNYNAVLKNLTKDIRIKDVSDSIQNHLIDVMLDARILSFYEKVSDLKMSEKYELVRGKTFIEPGELCSIYKNGTQDLAERNKRIRCDSIIISPSDAKNINIIEKVNQTNYGHVVIVGNDTSKALDALTVTTELNRHVLYTTQGIKTIDEWRDLMNRVLRDCLIDGKETVLALKVTSDEYLVDAILADVTCICCYKLVPPRYLTRLMLSEFGEKHTLEGKGIWEMLETKLSALKVSLVMRSSNFSWFMNCHRMLLSMLILIWWGDPSKKEQEQEILDELHNSELFSKQQIEQIMKVIDDLVAIKTLNTRAEKLKMLSTIMKLAKKKREEVRKTMTKYEKGMEKMKRAEEQVAGMQGELLRLQPQLAESEAELASAIPALESAVEALETMTQSDVSSLKTMRFPPYAVRLCMEAVCILLGVKPAKITNEIGEVVNDYWVSGQKLLSDIHFLAKIRSFARDTISKKTMKLIREKYLSKEEFDPENVKQCSLAAEGLCRWVLAIDMYNQISKIVEPKRERLRKAEVLVKQHLKQLEVKRKALLKVTEKLQGLSDQFSQMCQKKQELESQISSCEIRMERAERLVQALSGEKDKWKSKITDIMHEDSLSVPYSVGSALALHVFGQLPIDQRQRELRKTMRSLFPKLEVTIMCDLKTLVLLVDDPICFVNDDNRALEFLESKFEKVVVSNQWTETERQQCLSQNSVLLFEICDENKGMAKEIEEAEYYSQMEDEIIIKIGNTHHEVNKNFRVFFRIRTHDSGLKDSIIIDNQFSDGELRHDICEKMGSANWFETLNHYNEMVESRNNDIAMMEKTENEMLDLLGRSKDLDDERAIDLLAEARNLQSSITARNKEIAEIETSLRAIELKMSNCIDYSMKVIRMCYSLHLFDRFYRISLASLIDVVQTKLFDNITEINLDEINHKISELFWNFLCHLLAWEDKMIVHHLLFHKMNYKVEKLEMEMKDRISMDSFMNFSSFILKTEPKQLILLKYDSEVYTTILQFGQVTRNANWRVYTILDHVILKSEKLVDEPIWLLLNVNKSDQLTIGKLKTVMEKLKNFPVVHSSFRIIVGYSDEIECSDELITLTSHRFYFSSSSSLSQQTRRILANLSIRTSLDKSEEKQRLQIIRLLSFHYGLKLRGKYDPEFTVIVDDADLLAMMKLYQELRNLSDQPNEIQDVMKVKSSVIEPIYYPKTHCPVQRNMMSAMIQWIIEMNLSIPADTLLKNLIREDNHNFEDFSHFMQSHDESILCGFNARISRESRLALDKNIVLKMKQLFEPDEKKSEESGQKIESRSFLSEIENGERELDARKVNNLTELVAYLKMQFCLKYKLAIAEVTVTAEFVNDNYELPKLGSDSDVPMVKLSHCVLFSAHFFQGEIRELHNRQNQFVTVLLKSSKRTGAGNPRSLPLICPSTQNSVAQIPFHSQFPIAHWHLRGVFVTSARCI
ncbi:hypothetical protein GCK72_017709 [Caenorhabditis remanei]|uniref:Uncharacterized protein n=1 Tax=Caenorhabditis remanei TaxID=31234 RepID=A0A6A5G8Z9_CAERE|nr:hypothetical protein GCK72_017709 [Caenorhabditis remanei]KAF1751155.1 hypothetical protein GCK72_017709 [Caenorhabditis remanei]